MIKLAGDERVLISATAHGLVRDALPAGSGGLVTRALRDLVLFETKGTFAMD